MTSSDQDPLEIDRQIDQLDERIAGTLPMREGMRNLSWIALGGTALGGILLNYQFQLGMVCLGPAAMALFVVSVWRLLLTLEARVFEQRVAKLLEQKEAQREKLRR